MAQGLGSARRGLALDKAPHRNLLQSLLLRHLGNLPNPQPSGLRPSDNQLSDRVASQAEQHKARHQAHSDGLQVEAPLESPHSEAVDLDSPVLASLRSLLCPLSLPRHLGSPHKRRRHLANHLSRCLGSGSQPSGHQALGRALKRILSPRSPHQLALLRLRRRSASRLSPALLSDDLRNQLRHSGKQANLHLHLASRVSLLQPLGNRRNQLPHLVSHLPLAKPGLASQHQHLDSHPNQHLDLGKLHRRVARLFVKLRPRLLDSVSLLSLDSDSLDLASLPPRLRARQALQ